MRATAINREAARLVGIDTGVIVTASFALAAGLGAVAGLVVAPLTQTAFDVGAGIGVKGFAAAVLGGLGNPVAAVGGGVVLGLLESMTAGYVNPLYKDAVAFVVLLAVLFVRPQGLFGRSRAEKV
jgi:branched-chain amino acid transport system permease protein